MLSLNVHSLPTRLPRVIMICFFIDIGLCIAYVIHYMIGQPYWKLTRLVDLNGEDSLCAWYSSIQFFCIFLLGSLFAYHKYTQNIKSFSLIVLPAIFLLMSIDESVQIHEWLGRKSDMLLSGGSRIGTTFQVTGIWMFVVGLPFFALFLFWIHSVKKYISDKPSSVRKLVIGMSILLSGALGVELLSNFVEQGLLVAEVAVEEGLEMIGATVILWSLYVMVLEDIPGIVQKNVSPED